MRTSDEDKDLRAGSTAEGPVAPARQDEARPSEAQASSGASSATEAAGPGAAAGTETAADRVAAAASAPADNQAQTLPTRPRLPLWRKLLRVAIVLVVFVAFNAAATFAFETYGGFAESVWYQYRQAANEPIDTLVIGSSVAEYAFDPAPLETELGARPQCLSTPAQSLRSTLIGVRRALADHDIKRVIVGTSYNTLIEETSSHSDLVFTQNSLIGRPFGEQVAGYADLVLNAGYVGGIESLTFAFPWAMSHVQYNLESVKTNIRNRLECPTPIEAQMRVDPRYTPLGHGFGSYQDSLDTTTFAHSAIAANNHWNIALNEIQLRHLAELCELCRQEGIELVVAVTPRPLFATIAYPEDSYARDMAQVQALVESRGGIYLDFSLAHKDYYDLPERDFIDDVHLNAVGAEHFSQAFAKTLAAIERGEDVSEHFWGYDEWGDFLASLDRIEYTWLDHRLDGSTLTLTANCYAAPGTEAEYEFAAKHPDSEEWQTVRAFGADPIATIDLDAFGIARYEGIDLRVRARRAGETAPDIQHTEQVAYRE